MADEKKVQRTIWFNQDELDRFQAAADAMDTPDKRPGNLSLFLRTAAHKLADEVLNVNQA